MKRKSKVPGVEKDNRGDNFKPEEVKKEMEQEKPKSQFNLKDLNKSKYLFEQMEIIKREIEQLKEAQNELQNLVAEILELLEPKEEKVEEETTAESLETKVKEHVESDRQKNSLFKPINQARGQK